MKSALLCAASVLFFCASVASGADEVTKSGELRAKSPDGKFAMRIVPDPAFAGADEIPSTAIRSVSLVTLPDQKPAGELMSERDTEGNFEGPELLWASDSKWCALHWSTPRFGYTLVFRREGDSFKCLVKAGELSAPVKGDIRNQYVSPVRWTKPGELLLKQETIYRGGRGEGESGRFTATYDAKSGQLRIRRVKN